MSTRKSAIGSNPLDSIIALPGRSAEIPRTERATSQESEVRTERVTSQGNRDASAGERRSAPAVTAAPSAQDNGSRGARTEKAQGRKRTRLTVKVPDEMVEELRDAVMFLHTRGVHTTLVGLIESAVDAELKRIKRKYNDGQDLPPRGAEIPVGRPISA